MKEINLMENVAVEYMELEKKESKSKGSEQGLKERVSYGVSTHDGAFSLLITSSTSIRVEVGFGGPLLFGTFAHNPYYTKSTSSF